MVLMDVTLDVFQLYIGWMFFSYVYPATLITTNQVGEASTSGLWS